MDHVDGAAREDLHALVGRITEYTGTDCTVSLSIQRPVRQHLGLGSKTALLLAAGEAINASLRLGLDQAELQLLSQRGGASGVGVNTYFDGGFVVDAGHPQDLVDDLLPSARRQPESVPPVVSRLAFPSDWSVWLLLPPGARVAGEDEVRFFRANTPLPKSEVLASLELVVLGVATAVAAGDLGGLRDSLREMHQTGFKAREFGAQSGDNRALLEACWQDDDLASGLSSMGPLVYVISDSDRVSDRLAHRAGLAGAELIGPLEARNRGSLVELA
jgi:beta-ribofuranosylaminobenzene 5'-phosphate synthase